jgi:hypothetical protein
VTNKNGQNEQRTRLGRKRLEVAADHLAHALRQLETRPAVAEAIARAQEAHGLVDEERVAARHPVDRAHQRGRHPALHQPGGLAAAGLRRSTFA